MRERIKTDRPRGRDSTDNRPVCRVPEWQRQCSKIERTTAMETARDMISSVGQPLIDARLFFLSHALPV